MKKLLMIVTVVLNGLAAGSVARAQTTSSVQTIKGPDERMKADILVVVAHPDDEGGVTPYLARAIYDEHKRVAVVFATRGGSGGNDFTREHGPALADIREQEARAACAKLGITNVWFLDGKDTASQNVLNSLANWGHGANLEALVRIVRLTRPEVIISWLPGIFIGENHGDHQASGVLATEAFDLAGDPVAFPAHVAGASKRLEIYLENLTPWQPEKLYFFSDADDQKQFAGSGPAYSIKEISPSQKKPYWRLAMDAATPHLTQFPAEIQQMTAMSDEQINKFMDDPQHSWWSEPMTLIFGKAVEGGAKTKTLDVFAGATDAFVRAEPSGPKVPNVAKSPDSVVMSVSEYSGPLDGRMAIGGVWDYYQKFRVAHDLSTGSQPSVPEIAIKSGGVVSVPFHMMPPPRGPRTVRISCDLPSGWKIVSGGGEFLLPADYSGEMRVDVQTPEVKKEDLKNEQTRQIVVRASTEGRPIGEVRLNVLLKAGGLPQ